MAAPRIRIFRGESIERGHPKRAEETRLVLPTVPWRSIFGNDRPVEVEIGCGRGGFLLAAAARHPDRNFFGLERTALLASGAQAALEKAGLTNARVLNCDARCVIRYLIQPRAVAAYHLYFPDPWWKRRHHRRRLYTGRLATDLARTLAPDGRVHVATDVPDLFTAMRQRFMEAGLEPVPALGAAPPTEFARRCMDAGRPVHQASFAHR